MTRRLVLVVGFAAAFFLFVSLGLWQLERREWKLDLISQVTQNQAAEPVPAPGPESWATLTPADAYRRVIVHGVWEHSRETAVQAMTVMGSGYWVLTPLRDHRGFTVLVNRGFVDAQHRSQEARPESLIPGTVTVDGLLRWTEPGGRFPSENLPGEDRWYSRDVAAIAHKRELPMARTAPYFVDATDASDAHDWPVAGLTVVRFRNAHLGYALTWFALAGLSVLGIVLLLKEPAPRR